MYFDPCAFALPEEGIYGNLGRNTVTGPGPSELRFCACQNFAFWKTRASSFAAEAFNVSTTPSFNRPELFRRVSSSLPIPVLGSLRPPRFEARSPIRARSSLA